MSDDFTDVGGDEGLGLSPVRRGVVLRLNEEIRAGASRLDAAGPGVSWEFRCECGDPVCQAMVAVTLTEFDVLKAREEPVLAVGHTVGAALMSGESRRLQDDAAALRTQAKQQRRRARTRVRGRVLVVDDNDAMRTAAGAVVSTAEELHLIGTAASGEEAIERLPELKPDFVLLDIRMPGIGGMDAAEIICRRDPKIVVVLYSADPTMLDRATRLVEAAAVLDKADLRPRTLDELWVQHRPRE